jgi:hypothetical protein
MRFIQLLCELSCVLLVILSATLRLIELLVRQDELVMH